MMVLTDESDGNRYQEEVAYLFDGEAPKSDRPGVFRRLASRFSGGELHPDAKNEEVPAPPLEDE